MSPSNILLDKIKGVNFDIVKKKICPPPKKRPLSGTNTDIGAVNIKYIIKGSNVVMV